MGCLRRTAMLASWGILPGRRRGGFTLTHGSAGASAYVAEALISDHVLSAQELEQVEQTLSSRYGIAQPDAP